MEKIKFRKMTIEEVILSEEFKDLTVRDLIEIFRCNISADTRTGVIKLKLRCHTDDEKRLNYFDTPWSSRFNHDNSFGTRLNSLSPQPLGYINPNPDDNKNEESVDSATDTEESEEVKAESDDSKDIPEDYANKETCPNYGLYHECAKIYDDESTPIQHYIEAESARKSLIVAKQKMEEAKDSADTKIIPFSQIDLPYLEKISTDYYNDEISLEDIKKEWRVDDTVELPILSNLLIGNKNIVSLTFNIVDFNRNPKGSSFDKSLITISTKYSVKENGVPIELFPLVKFIEEKDGISYFTI